MTSDLAILLLFGLGLAFDIIVICCAPGEDKGATIVSCPRCHAPGKMVAGGPRQCHACGHKCADERSGVSLTG